MLLRLSKAVSGDAFNVGEKCRWIHSCDKKLHTDGQITLELPDVEVQRLMNAIEAREEVLLTDALQEKDLERTVPGSQVR